MFLLVVLTSGAGFVLLRASRPSALAKLEHAVQARQFWVPLCAIFLVAYLALQVCSAAYPGYLEHVEPHVASVSFILLHGGPLYHDLAGAQRYSYFYGPMSYLPYTLALGVLGARVLSLKLVVIFANLLMLVTLWRSYRKLLDPARTLLMVTLVVSFLLLSGDYVFQVRGDILVISFVALGLFAALHTSPWVSALLLGIACGLSLDIKLTALFYFFPLYILSFRRHGWRGAVLAAIAAAVFALAPFLSPSISAARYLEFLGLASRQPFSRVEIPRELKLLLLMCAPLGLLLAQLALTSRRLLVTYWNKNRMLLVALGSLVAAVTITSSKIGAGSHHFMPFYPMVGYVCAEVYREIKGAAVAKSLVSGWNFIPLLWVWLAVAVAMQLGTGLVSTGARLLLSRPMAAAVTRDLDEVMKNHPGKTIEMGYGELKGYGDPRYELTYFRPALVFAGNPLTVDAMALDDMQLSGIEIPPSTLEYLQQCKTQIWLIPKGSAPFVLLNIFSLYRNVFPEHSLFSDEFRRIFYQEYRKEGSSKYFDIWECEPEAGRKPQDHDGQNGRAHAVELDRPSTVSATRFSEG